MLITGVQCAYFQCYLLSLYSISIDLFFYVKMHIRLTKFCPNLLFSLDQLKRSSARMAWAACTGLLYLGLQSKGQTHAYFVLLTNPTTKLWPPLCAGLRLKLWLLLQSHWLKPALQAAGPPELCAPTRVLVKCRFFYWPPSIAPQASKQTSPSFVLKYSNLCEGSEQLCSSCSLLDEISRIFQVERKSTQKGFFIVS